MAVCAEDSAWRIKIAMVGDDWSRDEVEATAAHYFDMLRHELAGLRLSKAENNERLRRLLRDRSKGSMEFKHANINAVLTLYGYPYIDGYKPRFNFQALLEQVVLQYLDVHSDFFEPLIEGPGLKPTTSPDPQQVAVSRLIEPAPDNMRMPQAAWSPTARLAARGETVNSNAFYSGSAVAFLASRLKCQLRHNECWLCGCRSFSFGQPSDSLEP